MHDGMAGTYRLKRIAGGWTHWAEVTVGAEPADRHEVTLDDDVFGWRRDVYGRMPGSIVRSTGRSRRPRPRVCDMRSIGSVAAESG